MQVTDRVKGNSQMERLQSCGSSQKITCNLITKLSTDRLVSTCTSLLSTGFVFIQPLIPATVQSTLSTWDQELLAWSKAQF